MGMNFLRVFLFPVIMLYSGILKFRNALFDWGLIKSQHIPFPSIGVGNLAVGGTGKSVVIAYLISAFKKDHKIAVLSRGYGRQTRGLQIADSSSTASTIGDEPLQFFSNHNEIQVLVSEKRVLGIQWFLNQKTQIDLLLLDDVMQHRYVKPHVLLLTTTYHQPYFSDELFPIGQLREPQSGAKRAEGILVTKCPETLTEEQMMNFKQKLCPAPNQQVFFAKTAYSTDVIGGVKKIKLTKLPADFLLVTGIADPKPLLEYLKSLNLNFKHLCFPDHHVFTQEDISQIHIHRKQSLVLTTEKDFARLKNQLDPELLYYLPIQMEFINSVMETEFLTLIKKKIEIL